MCQVLHYVQKCNKIVLSCIACCLKTSFNFFFTLRKDISRLCSIELKFSGFVVLSSCPSSEFCRSYALKRMTYDVVIFARTNVKK